VGGADDALMPLACAVEMIHTYSLIHDDLPAMDNDDLRRGKPTSHKVFGEAIAILAGDALLTRAFHVLVEMDPRGGSDDQVSRRLRAAGIVGAAAGTSGLIGGQVADLEAEGRDDVTLADLERLHRAKTGALLGACVVGGGVLGGAGEADLGRLARFGDAIGLAFQVVDDILDATEGAAQLGKTAGKDVQAQKATYPSIVGLEASRRLAAGLVRVRAVSGGNALCVEEIARRVASQRVELLGRAVGDRGRRLGAADVARIDRGGVGDCRLRHGLALADDGAWRQCGTRTRQWTGKIRGRGCCPTTVFAPQRHASTASSTGGGSDRAIAEHTYHRHPERQRGVARQRSA
jgi:geranylgeranyl pyrophosphate synthase